MMAAALLLSGDTYAQSSSGGPLSFFDNIFTGVLGFGDLAEPLLPAGSPQADYLAEILRAGQPVNLAAREMQLLRHLIDHRGQVLSRDLLLKRVWQDQQFIGPRTVDVHISWLRQKLEPNPQSPRYIVTVRGEGYSFQP